MKKAIIALYLHRPHCCGHEINTVEYEVRTEKIARVYDGKKR